MVLHDPTAKEKGLQKPWHPHVFGIQHPSVRLTIKQRWLHPDRSSLLDALRSALKHSRAGKTSSANEMTSFGRASSLTELAQGGPLCSSLWRHELVDRLHFHRCFHGCPMSGEDPIHSDVGPPDLPVASSNVCLMPIISRSTLEDSRRL